MQNQYDQIHDINSKVNDLLIILHKFLSNMPPSDRLEQLVCESKMRKGIKTHAPIIIPTDNPEFKNKIIYVLELENKNFFIYVSEPLSDYKILINCELFYDFTKQNKPIKIIKKIPIYDEFQVDKIVKTYMNMYGYAYVRGGSYSNSILTKSQEETIQQELDYIEYGEKYEYSFSQILQFQNKHYHSIEEIDSLISKTHSDYIDYIKDKSKYHQLFPKEYKVTVNDIKSEDIDWLYDTCLLMNEYISDRESEPNQPAPDFSLIYIQKYQLLLKAFRHLYYLYENTGFFYSINDNEYRVYLKYPQFLFDQFFYHTTTYKITSKSLNTLSEICFILKTMVYIVHNRIEEYRFDMRSHGNFIEWTYPRIIYILEKKKYDFPNIPIPLEVD